MRTTILIVVACITAPLAYGRWHERERGYARYSDWPVRGCTHCPAGYGVATRCSAEGDTVCRRCGDDEWSPARHHLRECSKCSTCGEGMYVKRACNAHRDTFCDACDSVNPTINADFTKKCLDAKSSHERAEDYAVHDVPQTRDSRVDSWQRALDHAETFGHHVIDQEKAHEGIQRVQKHVQIQRRVLYPLHNDRDMFNDFLSSSNADNDDWSPEFGDDFEPVWAETSTKSPSRWSEERAGDADVMEIFNGDRRRADWDEEIGTQDSRPQYYYSTEHHDRGIKHFWRQLQRTIRSENLMRYTIVVVALLSCILLIMCLCRMRQRRSTTRVVVAPSLSGGRRWGNKLNWSREVPYQQLNDVEREAIFNSALAQMHEPQVRINPLADEVYAEKVLAASAYADKDAKEEK